MIKTAIFVEGHTELILVREMLLKMFGYTNISLDCFTLFTDSKFVPAEYAFPNEAAEFYFQVINVGNDNSVLSRILRRQERMWNEGFGKIIGLRDMYSREYREAVKNSTINAEVNQLFINGTRGQIKSEKVFFSFAIMEVEAWLLGLYKCFEKMDAHLTSNHIKEQLGIDLEKTDPEITFFHPANNVESIFKLAGKTYNKSKGDVSSVVSYIDREDYIELANSNKCASFKEFYEFIGF